MGNRHRAATPASTPLQSVLQRHGATIVKRDGWYLASDFGSVASEMAVCLSTVGITDRSDRATLELRGAPADVDRALSLLADPPWRVRWLRRNSRTALVRCERIDVSRFAAAMAPAEGTAVVDLSQRYAAVGIIGPRADELLHTVELAKLGLEVMVLRDSQKSYELVISAGDGPALWSHLLAAGAAFGVACVGFDALERLSVSRGDDSAIPTEMVSDDPGATNSP